MPVITAIGVDMALANMGLVRARVDLVTLEVQAFDLRLVVTSRNMGKNVRSSSIDMERARHLGRELVSFSAGASVAFAEVPSGSQSAIAAKSLGIALGVLSQCPLPIVEVSPMEVKNLFAAKRTVPKSEIIEWATSKWPDAPWLRTRRKGQLVLTQDNEHLADACATIVAGIKTQQFKLLTALHHEITMPDHNGPAPGRPPRRRVSLGAV